MRADMGDDVSGRGFSPQTATIPEISTPSTSWRRDAQEGAVMSAPLISNDAMMGIGASPALVDWLHQAASFSYLAPTEEQEVLVEKVFRRCKFDGRCAAGAFAEAVAGSPEVDALDAQEGLLSWWCRRCWEERQVKRAAASVGLGSSGLAQGFMLSSWCRFAATARRTSRGADKLGGGTFDLFGTWRRCRTARSQPALAAAEAAGQLQQDESRGVREAVDTCCGDPRCLTRALVQAGEGHSRPVWERTRSLLGAKAFENKKR